MLGSRCAATVVLLPTRSCMLIWLCFAALATYAPLSGNSTLELRASLSCCLCHSHMSISKHRHECAGSQRSRTHVTHTPARRLLRALLAMSEDRARDFLTTAVRTLRRVAVEEWTEDVSAAFFWWSNVQQMRLFLSQVAGGEVQVPGEWEWLQEQLDPLLLVRFVFVSGMKSPQRCLIASSRTQVWKIYLAHARWTVCTKSARSGLI
jgi:hypothetical protein